MATVNGDKNAVATELKSSSSESSAKTLKRKSEQVDTNDPPNEVKDDETNPPPNKIASFELNVKSNNTQVLGMDLAEYAKRLIQNFTSTETVTEGILDKNPVPTNNKRKNLLDLYFRKLMVEQNKHIALSQDKSLINLQQKLACVYRPLRAVLDMEKQSM